MIVIIRSVVRYCFVQMMCYFIIIIIINVVTFVELSCVVVFFFISYKLASM